MWDPDGYTSSLPLFLVVSRGLGADVCDGAHWMFVMIRKSNARPSEAWTGHPSGVRRTRSPGHPSTPTFFATFYSRILATADSAWMRDVSRKGIPVPPLSRKI